MPKTTTEKIQSKQEEIKQHENELKRLIQQQRAEEKKARTHRLCERGGIVEKLLPDLATFTSEQFDIFTQKVLLSEQTKRVIADISAGKALHTANAQTSIFTRQTGDTAETEPAEAEQGED